MLLDEVANVVEAKYGVGVSVGQEERVQPPDSVLPHCCRARCEPPARRGAPAGMVDCGVWRCAHSG